MDLELNGKNALILGASSGIGFAIAKALSLEGVKVAICSRNPTKLSLAAKELGAAHYFVGDLTRSGVATEVTNDAIKVLGRIDILVTNTGGPKRGDFMDIPPEQWTQDFQSIWMSVVESVKVALPGMKENNYGRILLVSSFAARDPRPGLTTSNGLRAGLGGLCRSIAHETAPFGVTVNALLPGYTNTERLKALKLTPDKIKSMVPAGRLGEPQELADLATFLASPRASYITGQSIVISGGA